MTVEAPSLPPAVPEKKRPVKNAKKDSKVVEELSEEDQKMKDEIAMIVERLAEPNSFLWLPALETLKNLITSAKASMSSVPPPLKFLRPHFQRLQDIHAAWVAATPGTAKSWLYETSTTAPPGPSALLADILAFVAMTFDDQEKRNVLKYCLAGSPTILSLWGHEFLRHLVSEMLAEQEQLLDDVPEDLQLLSDALVPQFLKHHAYIDACDVAQEINATDALLEHIDSNVAGKVCSYLEACASHVSDVEVDMALDLVYDIHCKFGKMPNALLVALRRGKRLEHAWGDVCLRIAEGDATMAVGESVEKKQARNDALMKLINDTANEEDKRVTFSSLPKETQTSAFLKTSPRSVLHQMAFLLARHRAGPDYHLKAAHCMPEDPTLQRIMFRSDLAKQFAYFAKELDILDAKVPEDVYKSHLEHAPRFPVITQDGTQRQNNASTFVNAFLNAGFQNDKLMTVNDDWLYKHKDEALMNTAASLGLIKRWDLDALADMDRFLASDDVALRAGGLLGIGILHCGIASEYDAALYLLTPFLETEPSGLLTIGAALGLGLAFIGSGHVGVADPLLRVLDNVQQPLETRAIAAVSLGFVFCTQAQRDETQNVHATLLETMMNLNEKEANEPMAKLFALAFALLYTGTRSHTEVAVAAIKAVPKPLNRIGQVLLQATTQATTGESLDVHALLRQTVMDTETKESAHCPFAVLAIATVAMGDELSMEMAMRLFNHMMHYGEASVRRVVPLAMALMYISNPTKITVLELLSKFSHDADNDVAQSAIFAMGLVGAGTNNARIAQLLRHLSSYYQKDSLTLFVLRLAQGLVHLGKGTLTLSPLHSDRTLCSPTALAGLLSLLVMWVDAKTTLLGRAHYLFYLLVPAMYPRFLITVDEELQPIPVSVRVGQAVDTVGQAGQRKTITGFQTYTTPVLIAVGERAELATDEYIALSPVLENIVIVRKDSDYVVDKK